MYQKTPKPGKSAFDSSTTNPFTPIPFTVQPAPEHNSIGEETPEITQYESLLKPIPTFAPGKVPPPVAPRPQLQMKLNTGQPQNAHTLQREQAPITIIGKQDNIIQRDIENETYKDTDVTNIAIAKLFFQAYNEAVQKAYTYATTVPSLGGYENLNGYTQLWVQKWNEHLSGGRPSLLAATFGYVIESLVSDSKSEFCPKISGGYSVDTQVTSGGTRPDLVLRLTKGTTHIAWLDLTAAKSVDHIYLKDDWLSKVLNFAEVTYPSLDPAILAFMKHNKDNKGSMTKEEFEKKLAAAKEEYKIQKLKWLEMGKDFSYAKLGNQVTVRDTKTKRPKKVSKEIQRLQPQIPREFIRRKLNGYFDSDEPIQEKMVPSILKAMGVNSTTWGYTTGYSVSEKAGEAWLIDNPVADESGE